MRRSVTCIGMGTLMLASVLVIPVTQAEVYKWVDDQGVVNYAESPGPNQNTEKLATEKSSTPSASQDGEAAAGQDANKATAQAGADAQYRENLEKLKKSCEESRKNLALLKGNMPVSKEIEGKFVTLNPEQRQAEIDDLEKSIQERCSGVQ